VQNFDDRQLSLTIGALPTFVDKRRTKLPAFVLAFSLSTVFVASVLIGKLRWLRVRVTPLNFDDSESDCFPTCSSHEHCQRQWQTVAQRADCWCWQRPGSSGCRPLRAQGTVTVLWRSTGVSICKTRPLSFFFFLIHRSHSISFTRAQGIPRYNIGIGREKDGRVGERLVEGGGGHGARDGGWGEQPSLAVMSATGQFKNWG
jgi:hypothetical protein